MANIFTPKRINIEQNLGKDLTEKDITSLMWDKNIDKLFRQYKNLNRKEQNTFKETATFQVKSILDKMDYEQATVKLISKGFEIVTGHTKLVTRGCGGALYNITWDNE